MRELGHEARVPRGTFAGIGQEAGVPWSPFAGYCVYGVGLLEPRCGLFGAMWGLVGLLLRGGYSKMMAPRSMFMPQVKVTSPVPVGRVSASSEGLSSLRVARRFWAGRTTSRPHSPALLL